MKKLFQIFSLCCLMFSIASCDGVDDDKNDYGIGSIYGLVVDGETGEPVRTAAVMLYSKGEQIREGKYDYKLLTSSVTYDDGHFEFDEVPANDYKITITSNKYLNAEYKLVVNNGLQTKVDIALLDAIANDEWIEVEDIAIMTSDTGEEMTNENATVIVEGLTAGGTKGWRLPTRAELTMMYKYRASLNIEDGIYWSCDKPSPSSVLNYSMDMASGYISDGYRDMTARVRAVRDINQEGSIYGLAIDGETGKTVSDATVKLYAKGAEILTGKFDYTLITNTVTSGDGHFTFDDVPAGDYKIVITSDKYLKTEYKLTVNVKLQTYAEIALLEAKTNDKWIEFEDIAILMTDTGEKMNIANANAILDGLSVAGTKGWRLPTRAELTMMYKYRGSLNLENDIYWTGDPSSSSWYYYVNMNTGTIEEQSSSRTARVRAVRDLKQITQTNFITINNIMVMKKDLGSAKYTDAESMCASCIEGNYHDWRLPTKEEAFLMFNNKDKLNLVNGFYWISTPEGTYKDYIDMTNGSTYYTSSSYTRYVRAVRTVTED